MKYMNMHGIQNDCPTLMHKQPLTHWGRVTHICFGNLTIVGSDNGLSPGRRQPIIWTSAGILLIAPIGTNFCKILIGILTFALKKMRLKVSSTKWLPFCLGLNVLITFYVYMRYTYWKKYMYKYAYIYVFWRICKNIWYTQLTGRHIYISLQRNDGQIGWPDNGLKL